MKKLMANSSEKDWKDSKFCTAKKMATANLKSLLVFMYLGHFKYGSDFKQDTLRQATQAFYAEKAAQFWWNAIKTQTGENVDNKQNVSDLYSWPAFCQELKSRIGEMGERDVRKSMKNYIIYG